MRQKTYVIYSRCSTEEQQKGFSHEYQRSGIESSPRIAGWKCVGYYSDTITGTNFVRDQLEMIYNLYKKNRGELDYILVYRFDRFGRDVGDAFQTIKRFRDIGIEINSPNKWIDYADPNYPLLLAIEFGMAQGESMKISDRTKDGLYAANCAGYFTGNAPAGYKRTHDSKRDDGKKGTVLVPDGEKAELVRKIFQLLADDQMNREQLYARYGKELGIKRSSFYRMFANPLYIGIIPLKAYKNNPPRTVQGKHEAIIEKDLFEQVQAKLAQEIHPKTFTIKRGNAKNYFYLKGSIHCAVTGKRMTGYQVKKRSGKMFYYYEAKKVTGGQTLNAIEAHQVINAAMREIEISQELYQETRKVLEQLISEKQAADKKRAEQFRKDISTNEQRLLRLQDMLADGEISAADYADLKTRYNTTLSECRKELIIIKAAQENELNFRLRLLDAMQSIGDIFRYSTVTAKKNILLAIFPEGFAIDAGNVRTERINSYIEQMIGISTTYEVLKIKTGLFFGNNPVGGERRDQDRTVKDRELLNFLFEAA